MLQIPPPKPFRNLRPIPIPQIKESTFIFGARCADGVVLVGDRKITDSSGEFITYREKIIHKFDFYVWASAGILGLANSFDTRFTLSLRKYKQFNQEEFFIAAEESFEGLTKVSDEYRYEIRRGNLQVLMATRIGSRATLHLLASIGAPTPVDGFVTIGSGAPFGAFWLDHCWSRKQTMRKSASLASWVIRHITDEYLDNAVGIDEGGWQYDPRHEFPQVWFVPDNLPNLPASFDNRIRETTRKESQKIYREGRAKSRAIETLMKKKAFVREENLS